MNLDIRIPIGGMFTILGALLVIYGLLTHGSEMYARSLSVNINLWWGLVMLAFGALMLIFGLRSKPAAASPEPSASPPRGGH